MKSHRVFQFSLRKMILGIALLALMLGLLLHYRYHLLWKFDCAWGDMADIQPVPVTPMPEAPRPAEWKDCRFASLEFALPLGLAKGLETVQRDSNSASSTRDVAWLSFRDGSRSLLVSLARWTDDDRQPKIDLQVPPEGQGLSPTQLRRAILQTNPKAFRWSMSPSQVRWHTWCVSMIPLACLMSPNQVETVICDDFEGLADFGLKGGTSAEFAWETVDGKYGGSILLLDKAHPIDADEMRCICQSVRFSREGFPERLRQDDAPQLFQLLSR